MSIASIISRVVNTIVRTHMVERLSNNRAFQEFAVKTTETYENLGKKAADGGAKVGEKASKVTESDGFREVADFAKYVCGTPRKASSRSPLARGCVAAAATNYDWLTSRPRHSEFQGNVKRNSRAILSAVAKRADEITRKL